MNHYADKKFWRYFHELPVTTSSLQANLLRFSNQIRNIHLFNSRKSDATGQRELDNIIALLQWKHQTVSYGSGSAHTPIMTN